MQQDVYDMVTLHCGGQLQRIPQVYSQLLLVTNANYVSFIIGTGQLEFSDRTLQVPEINKPKSTASPSTTTCVDGCSSSMVQRNLINC